MHGLSASKIDAVNIRPEIPLRSAGVLFLIVGLVNLFYEALLPVHVLITIPNIAYVIYLLVGILLVLKIQKVIIFARFTVIAGVVLQGGYLIMHVLYLAFMLHMVLYGGLWILLSPRSSEYKILYVGGIVSVSLILLVDIALPVNRFEDEPTIVDRNVSTISATVDTAFGNAFTYRLDFGKNIWHLRNPEAYKKNNPSTDLWLVDPQEDAHLIVIGEKTEDGSHADLNAFAAAVQHNLFAKNPSARLVNVSRLYGVYYDGTMLRLQSNIGGVPLEYVVGLYTIDDYAFQVIGYTHKKEFASVEPDLIDAIKSFYFDTDAQQKLDHLRKQYPIAEKMD